MPIDRGHHTDLDYHRRMLDDLWRVEAYDRAIRELVRPGDVVLDLGAGTGILAMLAARRGARVHAVESASVGAVAERLIAANGLSDRIALHRQDAVTMEPVEPVDWVIGEFMGRFVVDDEMLDAVAAAGRWLKPGGAFCPRRIRMQLAPAGGFELRMVDRWRRDLLGLDLSAALPLALNTCYAASVPSHALLAEPEAYAELLPPERPERFDAELVFEVRRAGLCRGVLGFWTAELTDSVALSTAPGIESHWGQYLFPCPPVALEVGDVLRFRLWLDEPAGLVWHWEGRVEGGARWRGRSTLSAEELPRAEVPAWTGDRERAVALANEAGPRFVAGDLEAARAGWSAAVRVLGPEADDLASLLFENLGIGELNAGDAQEASLAFARALAGGTSPEQSLKLLIQALAAAHRPMDAERMRALYEATYARRPG